MLLCGRIFLGARSPHVIFPQIWERTGGARAVRTFESFLAMDPFSPRILSGAT